MHAKQKDRILLKILFDSTSPPASFSKYTIYPFQHQLLLRSDRSTVSLDHLLEQVRRVIVGLKGRDLEVVRYVGNGHSKDLHHLVRGRCH